MTYDESIDILNKREYIVSKSNLIVQKSRYELSLSEQKSVAYICSLIKPRSDADRINASSFIIEYEFNIRDYCLICGIDYNNGKNYMDVKSLLRGLISKVMWLTLDDGTETSVNWVNKVWTNKGSGKVRIRLDEDMIPYLFDLQNKFTSYGLSRILAMKSQYSIRLYELLKSYAYQNSKVFDLIELKKILMVDSVKSYSDYSLFRKKVLEPAQKEINELTDINISFSAVLKGRKTIKVRFLMLAKTPIELAIGIATVKKILDDK